MRPTIKFLWIAILLIGGVMSACTPTDDENSPLPSQEFQTLENPVVATDLPAEPTADTQPVQPTATSQGARPLPPTWTPTFEPRIAPTDTLAPTLDSIGTWEASSPVPPATVNPGCLTFNLDPVRTVNTIRVGESPILAWKPATGATLYRVYVFDDSGRQQLHEELLEGTTVTVNRDVFPVVGTYVWTVAPLDAFGIQMCTELGDGIVVSR